MKIFFVSLILVAASILAFADTGLAQADIHKINFKNFTYPAYCVGEKPENVTVKNGEFSRETPEDGYVDRFSLEIFSITYGDLNGDNKDEAVILSVCNTGGTGNFSEGYIYTLKAGKPVLIGRIPGGDRAEGGLRGARVENGELIVESNDPGKLGGLCCPEFSITTKYKFANGKLTTVSRSNRKPLYPEKRISFPPGTSGTTVTLSIKSNDLQRLVVGGRAGQTLTVSSDNDQAEIRLLTDAEVTEGKNTFSATLPKNDDYVFEVGNYGDTELKVTLTIKIK